MIGYPHDDLEEELRSHIHHRADDLQRSGLTRAEAERRARIEFGGQGRFKEECREAAGGNLIETLAQDARYSLRVLRKSPGFALVAVVTLALAIGANAVVFGVWNGLVLRPLNVPHPESLYAIERSDQHSSISHSYPDYLDLRDRNRTFEGLAGFNVAQAGVDTGRIPSVAWIYDVTGNYFDVLGIQPYLGRFFHTADEHGPDSAPYVVLPYSYWHSHFQDDRGVVGRVVRVNKHPFTILGVAPPGFHGTILFLTPDLFVPLVNQKQVEGKANLNARGIPSVFMVIGHLKPGVTPPQALSDLNSIGSYLKKTFPQDHGQTAFTLARPALLGDTLGRPAQAFLTALMVLAALILLAACTNLGSLFASRAADRSREVALRLALGSSRSRILRGLFTEAFLIALAGGAAGLAGSILLLRSLSVWQPVARFPLHIPVNPDANVYVIALLLALASGLLFGIVPVRQVLRTDPYQIVKSGSTARVGRRLTPRDVLLCVQIAICAVLVTSSMVAVRGLLRSRSDFGFEPRNTMLLETVLNMEGYTTDATPVMQRRMIDAVKKVPGVASVGLIDWPPLVNGGWKTSMVFADSTTDLRPANNIAEPGVFCISGEYFHAAGTALLAGRTFTWHDDAASPRVAVITREFARQVFGDITKSLGRSYKMQDGTRIQVVGVVEDGKYNNLAEEARPAMFFPILQEPRSETSLVIRSARDPEQLAAALRSTVRALDPGLPAYIETWNRQLDLALFPSHIATLSLGVLGIIGAMLSITGIFGMAAYSVSRRMKELGIRMALGAQRKEVLQAALGRSVRLLAFGSTAGLVLGILASRVLASIVYQANPRDPLVLAAVVLAMVLMGLIATWIPAQRALSVDPLKLLREE